jgi:uroporphyrinogen decarboxylase
MSSIEEDKCMSAIMNLVQGTHHAIPCYFYPEAKKMGITVKELLTDREQHSRALLRIADQYPVGAVIRMTELWCEAAAFGMQCSLSDDDFPKLKEPIVTEADELSEVAAPSVDNEILTPLIEAVRLAAPNMKIPLIVGITGPYTLASVLNGSGDFMMNCMTDPDETHAFLKMLTAFLVDYALEYKKAGANAIMLAEPSISMISPDMTAEFSNPYIRTILDAVQDENFSLIYHNCGAVNKHMDTIMALNADAFHFGREVDLSLAFEKSKPNTLIMGNLDPNLFLEANAEKLCASAHALCDQYGENKDWRLSTGCDLSPRATDANLQAFFQGCGE